MAVLRIPQDGIAAVDEQLVVDASTALRRGALVAMILAVVGTLSIPILSLGGASGLWLPWMFCWLCLGACGALYVAARRGCIRGAGAYAVMLPWVSLPTLFFLLCELYERGGAAAFVTGPYSYLYSVLLAVAGLAFNVRLSVVCGAVAAGGYLLSAWLALPLLSEITAPLPQLQQDLRDFGIYVMRGMSILFCGMTVAILGWVARRFTIRMLLRQQERERVERLFGQYVSPEVANRLLNDPTAPLGQRREVVILFCDLRGFTAYGETAEPEEIVRRLNQYFDEMGEAITGHGGVIDKYIGDAVMSVFGGLVRLENPCEAAVRAALAMRERLERLNQQWALEGFPGFRAGIGIHLGEVVQGALGSEHRRDFTVIGDAVNTASRIEELTKQLPHSLLISGAVRERLGPDLAARCAPLGELTVKGRKSALSLYGVQEGLAGRALVSPA